MLVIGGKPLETSQVLTNPHARDSSTKTNKKFNSMFLDPFLLLTTSYIASGRVFSWSAAIYKPVMQECELTPMSKAKKGKVMHAYQGRIHVNYEQIKFGEFTLFQTG